MPKRTAPKPSDRRAVATKDFKLRAAKVKESDTPAGRIELWLKQIEQKANSVLRALEETLPIREKALTEAQEKNAAARSAAATADTAANRKAVRKATKACIDASNALYPKLWPLANSALRNAALVRKKLKQSAADEAVEAALRAVHAAWELDDAVFEKQHKAGLKGHASWSSGGRKRAKLVAHKLGPRNEDIVGTFKALKRGGRSFPESVAALHERYGLSKRQIKRILAQMDTY